MGLSVKIDKIKLADLYGEKTGINEVFEYLGEID